MDKKILGHINKGQVYAIIPARSGSKGVKDKNILTFFGHPMIAYTIAAAALCKSIDRIIVSTDSEKYAGIAEKYGAEVPFLRPAEISGDGATDIEFMMHAINWFYENEGSVPQYWAHLRVTSPLRTLESIDAGIAKIKRHPEATCLVSVNEPDFLTAYKWLVKDGDYIRSIFFDDNDRANMPRQSYPTAYIPNNCIDVLTTECIVAKGRLHGERMLCLETDATPDVDSLGDLKALMGSDMGRYKALSEYLERMKMTG